jgi:hypothetical protein
MTAIQILKTLVPQSFKGFLKHYDFLPMYCRPLDNALWQSDAFFVRNDSQLVALLSWD